MNYIQLLNYTLINPIILISLLVILLFKIFPPKKINSWYGYRTLNSQKSYKNWCFAQRYIVALTLPLNIILFIIQLVLYILFGNTSLVDLGLIVIWILGMVLCIYKVELKLKKI